MPRLSRHTGAHDAPGAAVAALLLTALAAGYYATYFLVGYNASDDGHYAQTAYEFWLGTSPRDVRFGYGLLWHHLGAWIFTLTGPDFAVVQGIFFAAAALTAGLVLAAARAAGAGWLIAAPAGAAVALVPAFPPTAFYALCAALNVWAQLRMVRRGSDVSAADAALAAAALGITFQIRADFGYIFTVSLFAALFCARFFAPREQSGWGPPRTGAAALAAAAAAAFVIVHAPLALAAFLGGWADLIVEDYLRIPKAVLYVLRLAFAGGGEGGGGGDALLARAPLSMLWRGEREQAALALLTWGPFVFFTAFALFEAVALLRVPADERPRRLAQDGVALTGGLAAFPHYFLFRPDLPHIANFMPGFVILLAVFAGRMATAAGRSPVAWGVAAPFLAAIGGFVGVYLWLGLTQPGTGSMQVKEGRDRPFAAENGVRTLLNADEETQLVALRDLILANSRPDQPIVCVPYCPGVAFMTGRRLLFREHYVDNSFLIGDPGWIERAVAATKLHRPPVLIISDWAINGTEASRFGVWARPYIEALEKLGPRRVDLPGMKVYLLDPAPEPPAAPEAGR